MDVLNAQNSYFRVMGISNKIRPIELIASYEIWRTTVEILCDKCILKDKGFSECLLDQHYYLDNNVGILKRIIVEMRVVEMQTLR